MALCVPSPRISPAIGARTCHTVHSMIDESRSDVKNRTRDRAWARSRPPPMTRNAETAETPQITASSTANRAQSPRRKIGERQQALLPGTLGEQELGEEPGDPDGDDRDQQLHDRDPPQAVPLPEREEDRERRQREHEDAAEIERETHGPPEGAGGERLAVAGASRLR